MQTSNLLEPQEEDLVTLTKPRRNSECGKARDPEDIFDLY